MQIYLAQPGGQKLGPLSADEVREGLRSGKYQDTGFWAFHDGLPNWVPLHSLKLPAESAPAPDPCAAVPSTTRTTTEAAPSNSGTVSPSPAPAPLDAGTAEAPGQIASEAVEGFAESHETEAYPYESLEQLFVFTSGEPRPVFQSRILDELLRDLTGRAAASIQREVPTHVVGKTNIGALVSRDQEIPSKAWQAIKSIEPSVESQARTGELAITLRAVRLEQEEIAAVLLFYNKNKLATAGV